MVRFIEIELDGVSVRALLNDEGAPATADAIWNALPFEGQAVHAQASGDMFRMLDKVPICDLNPEHAVMYNWPGLIVYYEASKEIAFCYRLAQFNGGVEPKQCTPLAEIEGDFSKFAERGDGLKASGAAPIAFRKSADQITPFRYRKFDGPKVEFQFGTATLSATVLKDLSPNATNSFLSQLPVHGLATNDDWGAKLTRLAPGDDPDGLIELDTSGEDECLYQVWPGYIYYDVERKRLYACYGNASVRDMSGAHPVVALAALDGDWTSYSAQAAAQVTEGVKTFTFRGK